MYISIYTYISLYILKHIYIYIFIYVYEYIYIHIYIDAFCQPTFALSNPLPHQDINVHVLLHVPRFEQRVFARQGCGAPAGHRHGVTTPDECAT